MDFLPELLIKNIIGAHGLQFWRHPEQLCSTGALFHREVEVECNYVRDFFTGNCQHLDMNTQGKKIRLLNS